MSGQTFPVYNQLLASLPKAALESLTARLTPAPLVLRHRIVSSGEPIDSVWFPQSGMISLVMQLEDGMQAEVGIVGREGMFGISLLAGMETSFSEAIVQLPGTALKMSASDFRSELASNAPFRALLLRYNEALHGQVMQTAACNGRHGLEQRLARWLLMAQDRADSADLPLTQDFMAMMLGVHRPSITVTAGILQRAGLIRYAGGMVTILDRAALEASSCECHGAVKKRFADLLGTIGGRGHAPVFWQPDPAMSQQLAEAETDWPARVADLEAEIRVLREDNARMHQVLSSALEYAIITMDDQGCITGWNAGARQIFGYEESEVLGRSGSIVFTEEDRNEGRFTRELIKAINAGRASNERWHERRDGSRFWASGLMMPLLDCEARPNGFLAIMRDRTEVQVQANQRDLLMAEMNHRVKNTFAMVQAIAGQSCRHAPDMEHFQDAFAGRLASLAQSHDMLVKGGWENAPLRDIVEASLQTYCGEPGRVVIDGPPILLAANSVFAFTLAFHELATNAAKHGALSTESGTVHVGWVVAPGEQGRSQVELVWRERGGPQVSRPDRQGFGSHLLSRGLGQFGGSLRLDFQPEGVECHVKFPA